ncbi:hypothetical protein [Cytobacillus horneckiae]|uniref:hypothetical protein n=1 Tax=Cytobacillus horneckiae TaxID=549687 RepID=UPI003D9A33E1
MAKLSNSLIIEPKKYSSGIAFSLLRRHELNEVLDLGNNWELILDSKSSYLILRGNYIVNNLDEFFNICYETVQRGLDILSINGKADISIADGIDEYMIWWAKQNIQYLRIVRVTDFKMGVSTDVTLTDKDGNIIKPNEKPQTRYHESLRYYRLSQITEDLFDSFRNMYLSFESLLSLHTKRRKSEPEGEWLKRALNNIGSLNSLEHLFEGTGGSIVNKFYKQIYINVRCSLFHAKGSTKKLVPQNLEDRKQVAKSLDILTQIVLMLANNLLNTNRENGVITNIGFSNMINDNFKSQKILLSESEKYLSKYEDINNSIHKMSFSFNAQFSKKLSIPGLSYFVGKISPINITNVLILNRFSFQVENELFSIHKIDGGLTLDGVNELQFQLGYRLENKNIPKRRFQY